LRENEYPRGIRILIATFTQGFTLREDDVLVHLVPIPKRQPWTEEIAQVIQRFRKPDHLDVHLYWNFPGHDAPPLIDLEDYHTELKEEAKRRANMYREELGLEEGTMPSRLERFGIRASEKEEYEDVHRDKHKVNLVRPDLRPNDWQRRHNVYEAKAENAYKQKPEMNRQFADLDLRLGSDRYCPRGIRNSSNSSSKSSFKTATDKEFEERLDECLTQLQTQWPDGNDEVARRVRFLASYFPKESVRSLLMEWGRTTRRWNTLKRRIRIQDPLSEADKELSEAVYSTFEVGSRYSSSEINDKIRTVYAEVDGQDTSNMSKTASTRILKDYFQAKRSPDPNTGKQKYRLLSDNPFEHELPQTREDEGGKYTYRASAAWL
jgi:hypothetical protein